MSLAATISSKVPLHHTNVMLVDDDDQNIPAIIREIKTAHKNDKKDYDQFSEIFWDGNAEKTGKKIFNFLKDNVTYKVEPPDYQTMKIPGRILYDGHGDCKHYSLFCTGVCDSLARKGYPIGAKYRFVADKPGTEVHHVFSVVTGKDGEYWCDPVLDRYNARPKFQNIKDATMAIYQLSGTTRGHQVAQVGLSIKKNPFKQFQHAMQVNAHNVQHGMQVNTANLKKGIQIDAKKGKEAVLKVGALPARKAFLSLVALNVRSLATNLAKWRGTEGWNRLMNTWKNKLGGDPKVLDQAIHNGQNRKRLGYLGVFGVDDATIASWTALAGAILAILHEFIHAPGSDTKQQEAVAAQEGAAHLLANAYHAGGMMDTAPAEATEALDAITQPGMNTGSMTITPGVTADGAPQLMVHDIDHPVASSAGRPDKQDGTPDTDGRSFLDNVKETVTDAWNSYKVPIVLGTGSVILYKVATAPPRRKSRK